MVVDEGQQGFGFIKKNEIINGKAAVIGCLLLLDFELLTGKGLLKGTGFLDFLYAASNAFKEMCQLVIVLSGRKSFFFPSIHKGELNEKTKMLKKSV